MAFIHIPRAQLGSSVRHAENPFPIIIGECGAEYRRGISSTMCHGTERLTASDPIHGGSQRIQDQAGAPLSLPSCSSSLFQQQGGFIPLTEASFCYIGLTHKCTEISIDPFISLANRK